MKLQNTELQERDSTSLGDRFAAACSGQGMACKSMFMQSSEPLDQAGSGAGDVPYLGHPDILADSRSDLSQSAGHSD